MCICRSIISSTRTYVHRVKVCTQCPSFYQSGTQYPPKYSVPTPQSNKNRKRLPRKKERRVAGGCGAGSDCDIGCRGPWRCTSLSSLLCLPWRELRCVRILSFFFAMDGTFIKEIFILTVLLAISVDADNHAVMSAWAHVEGEPESS